MGLIEDPLFHDRIVLGEDRQKELVRDYASLFKHKKDAAENLGIKPTTFYAYYSFQNKSIPFEIYNKILDFLELEKHGNNGYKRKTLTEIQQKSLVDMWSNDRGFMLKEAKKASKLGVERLEEIYGENWRECVAEIAREGLKRKYGDDCWKYISRLSHESWRKKYGEKWRKKIIEKATKVLKETYGEKFWENLLPMAHQALEDKYGTDWATKISRMGWEAQEKKYGPEWREITLRRAREELNAKYGPDAHKIIGRFGPKSPKIIKMIKSGSMCSECYSTNVITDYIHNEGEIVCGDCGIVLNDRIINMEPEWRAFDKEQKEKLSRVGPPVTLTLHDKGLGSVIDWRDYDIHGGKIKQQQKAQNYRLRKLNKRSRIRNGRERSLARGLNEINILCDKLGLPRNISETASTIFRKASKKRLLRGRNIKGMSAAVVYTACRQMGITRTTEDISKNSISDQKEIERNYRNLVNELEYYEFVRPNHTHKYITMFSNKLFTNGKAEDIAHMICNAAKEEKLTAGRNPKGIAAASCYIGSILGGERRTQSEVSIASDVTEVTVRNRYKNLFEKLLFEFEL